MNRILDYGTQKDGTRILGFECPGCGYGHSFRVGGPSGSHPQWTWNGSMEAPTFAPSLLVYTEHEGKRQTLCHSFVRDGRIEFLPDCRHKLAGQTVDLGGPNP